MYIFVSLFGASLIDLEREIRLQQETRTRTHITMDIFPSSPDIFIQILLTSLPCLKIKTIHLWRSFPKFS